MRMIDVSGEVFGRLTVVGESAKRGRVRRIDCVCKCGTLVTVDLSNLRRGFTQSCGCLHREITSENTSTHRLSKSITYVSWQAMHARCSNSNLKSYQRYGAKGVVVCDQWASFEAFLADMGERPGEEYSIDRFPDTTGNYEPSNCRWATRIEQARNKTSNRVIEFDGLTVSLIEHCERRSLSYKTVHQRLRRGASIESALSKPTP